MQYSLVGLLIIFLSGCAMPPESPYLHSVSYYQTAFFTQIGSHSFHPGHITKPFKLTPLTTTYYRDRRVDSSITIGYDTSLGSCLVTQKQSIERWNNALLMLFAQEGFSFHVNLWLIPDDLTINESRQHLVFDKPTMSFFTPVKYRCHADDSPFNEYLPTWSMLLHELVHAWQFITYPHHQLQTGTEYQAYLTQYCFILNLPVSLHPDVFPTHNKQLSITATNQSTHHSDPQHAFLAQLHQLNESTVFHIPPADNSPLNSLCQQPIFIAPTALDHTYRQINH